MVGRKCLADLLDRDTRLPDIRSLILVRECLLACGVVRGEQGAGPASWKELIPEVREARLSEGAAPRRLPGGLSSYADIGSEEREAVDWKPDSWPRLELARAPVIMMGSYTRAEEDWPIECVRTGAW